MREKLRQMMKTRWKGIGSIYFRGLVYVVLTIVSEDSLTSFGQEPFIQDEIRNEHLTKTSHNYCSCVDLITCKNGQIKILPT